MLVPMTSTREVIDLSHESVGAPRYRVCDAGSNFESATRTGVILRSASRSDGLHIPETVAARLSVQSADEGARQVKLVVVVACSVAA